MSKGSLLEIVDLHASIEGKEILQGVNLKISAGETHAIMGPNGSGKSTLSYVLLGHPRYRVEKGDILWKGESILDWPTEKRAIAGIFLSFQYPTAIPGVTIHNFLRSALKNLTGGEVPIRTFRDSLKKNMESLHMDNKIVARYVNEGFSGGERKRNEILQLKTFQPQLAILDEIDSGLDIDALQLISKQIEELKSPERSFLLITHYQRLLNHLSIDKVHIFVDGCIAKSGDMDLARQLEKEGYKQTIAKSTSHC